jgi:hypothetical protein
VKIIFRWRVIKASRGPFPKGRRCLSALWSADIPGRKMRSLASHLLPPGLDRAVPSDHR